MVAKKKRMHWAIRLVLAIIFWILFMGLFFYFAAPEIFSPPPETSLEEINQSIETSIEEIVESPKQELYFNEIFLNHSGWELKTPVIRENFVWYTNRISYTFFNCENKKDTLVKEMKSSLDLITDISGGLITFIEKTSNAKQIDLEIHCSRTLDAALYNQFEGNLKGLSDEKSYSISNPETGVTHNFLVEGNITIFDSQCSGEASVHTHELLHVFGFTHVEDSKDVLNQFSDCTSKIGEDTKADLITIYSIFEEINDTKLLDYPSEAVPSLR